MTQRMFAREIARFEKELARLSRRQALMERVKRGDATLRRVRVKEHYVPGYDVGVSYRYIEDRRERA